MTSTRLYVCCLAVDCSEIAVAGAPLASVVRRRSRAYGKTWKGRPQGMASTQPRKQGVVQ